MKEYRDRFGAKCSVCDYNKVQSALQFHHKNPEDKKEKIAVWAGYDKHKDSIEEELKKCILVCSNCHLCLIEDPHDDHFNYLQCDKCDSTYGCG